MLAVLQPRNPPMAAGNARSRKGSGAWASSLAISVLGILLLGSGCNREPQFEDVPPAAELFAEGQNLLKGRKILGVYKWVRYEKAIETFQAIIDNYPYSDYEIEAQLQIADAYFDDAKYDEALSYYRDFADLHPQNPRVPYTILRSALCHYNQIKKCINDTKIQKCYEIK